MLIAEKQVSQAEALHCCVPHTNRYTFIDGHPVFEALIVEILFREVPVCTSLYLRKMFPAMEATPFPQLWPPICFQNYWYFRFRMAFMRKTFGSPVTIQPFFQVISLSQSWCCSQFASLKRICEGDSLKKHFSLWLLNWEICISHSPSD